MANEIKKETVETTQSVGSEKSAASDKLRGAALSPSPRMEGYIADTSKALSSFPQLEFEDNTSSQWTLNQLDSQYQILASSDKRILQRIESSFLNANFVDMYKLLDATAPNKEANSAVRSNFSHAFGIFTREIGKLGYNATYDEKTGVMRIDKSELGPNANVTRIVIDPVAHRFLISRSDQGSMHNISLDTKTGKGHEVVLKANPFKQLKQDVDANDVLSECGAILRDDLKARTDAIERENLRKDQASKAERESRIDGKLEQLEQKMDVDTQIQKTELIMENQRRIMRGQLPIHDPGNGR